jgi:hypothetical protein
VRERKSEIGRVRVTEIERIRENKQECKLVL